MKKSTLLNGVKYGVGLALLAYVIWSNWAPAGRDGLSSVWQAHVVEHQPVNVGPLGLAVGIGLCSVLLTFIRWYVLVRAQGLPFTLANALRLGMIGYFLSIFLPSSIGGDIIKAAFIAREQSRRTVAVATVIIDRVIGLWGLCWLVALVGGFFWAVGYRASDVDEILHRIVLTAVGLVVGSVIGWFLLGVLPAWRAERFAGRLEGIPKVGHSAAEFWRAVWMYRCQGKSVAIALGMSVVGHVGFVLTFYFASLTLRRPDQIPSLAAHFLIIPIGLTFQAGFPAPGGLGGGEFIFGKLYGLINPLMEGNGALASLVQRTINWTLGLVGYIVYLRMRPALVKEQEPAGEDQEPEADLKGVRYDGEIVQGQPQLIREP